MPDERNESGQELSKKINSNWFTLKSCSATVLNKIITDCTARAAGSCTASNGGDTLDDPGTFDRLRGIAKQKIRNRS